MATGNFTSHPTDSGETKKGRVHDPHAGPPTQLDQHFASYDQYFRDSPSYERHLLRVIAGYSRGDGPAELRSAFSWAVHKLEEADVSNRKQTAGEDLILGHRDRY